MKFRLRREGGNSKAWEVWNSAWDAFIIWSIAINFNRNFVCHVEQHINQLLELVYVVAQKYYLQLKLIVSEC